MKLRRTFLVLTALVVACIGAEAGPTGTGSKAPVKEAAPKVGVKETDPKAAPKEVSKPPAAAFPTPPLPPAQPTVPVPGSPPIPPNPLPQPTESIPGFPPTPPNPLPQPVDAWLGLSVVKPEPSVAAQIPSLPPGIGFVIESVMPAGPAAAAELRPLDVIWKFGDQMLVNQAQLATLLNLKRPGDEVKLAIFRAGQPLDVTLKLGAAPPNRNAFGRHMFPDDPFCEEKIVIPGERVATYSTDQGKAVVKREGEAHHVTITDNDQKVLFDGVLPPDGNLDAIPDGWHKRVWVLRRSLDHAMANQIVPVRPPRPRVIPTPEAPPMPPGSTSGH